MATLTIAILNYNGKDYLEACLKSVPFMIAGVKLEKLLIDNSSTDGSYEIAHKYGFKVVHADNRDKFITGLNMAICESSGEYFLFSQADLRFVGETFRHITKAIIENPESIIQPVIYGEDGSIDNSGMNWIWPGYGIRIRNKFAGFRRTDIATTITFMTSRKVLNKIGLFDIALSPAYYEDVDFALRCKKKGFKHYVLSKAMVIHNHTTSFSKYYSKNDLSRICFKNRQYIVRKHYRGFDRWLRLFFIRAAQQIRILITSLYNTKLADQALQI